MTLVKALDHEATAMIEVIITLTGNVLAFLNFFYLFGVFGPFEKILCIFIYLMFAFLR